MKLTKLICCRDKTILRKLKLIIFSIFSILIVAIFGAEVFAAAIMNFTISGSVQYYATEISASIWATKAYNALGEQGQSVYMGISGDGEFRDYIYTMTGSENSYDNIVADAGTTQMYDTSDELEMYVFVKNNGDRSILTGVTVDVTEPEKFNIDFSYYYFDVSVSGQINPYDVKASSATPTSFISTVETEITNNRYSPWQSNSSIDTNDVLCIRILISVADQSAIGNARTDFDLHIGFMADIQYTSNNVLSVFQPLAQTDPSWTKFGYNSMLSANATKVETNSLSNLYTYLRDADANGNANITYGIDDYHLLAPVYKDIDHVNIDINTGEIIGKLSDVSYDFEWFGRDITLEAGSELASGRVLETDETFTVDVYTYYPTMYIRRWVVGDKQWLSISDETFVGAVEVPEFYVATFESTIFNPDHSVAANTYGIIPRSYVTDRCPLSGDSVAYMQNKYGYGTYTGSTTAPSQTYYLGLTANLTQAWANSGLSSAYKTVAGAQGENWVSFIPNILSTIKYANNNMQIMVGKGNVESFDAVKNKTYKDYNGNNISLGSGANANIEGIVGGGTIGVYNSSQKGTATYDSANHYKLSETGYNVAGLNYGYNSTYTNGSDRQGLYAPQFLTYSTGTKRYLCDGYVGSDGYTSVFCMGQCNTWGNSWTWIFGTAALYDGSNVHAYINFDDYDSTSASTTWQLAAGSRSFEAAQADLISRSYSMLSYNLPTSNTYYRTLGTSVISNTPLESLIGLPAKAYSSATDVTGLCDYYYFSTAKGKVYGIAKGGAVNNTTRAGPFYLSVDQLVDSSQPRFGFRACLILASS